LVFLFPCHGNVLLVYAFLNVTPEERELLETTARSLLKLQHDFADRISGMDILLQEMVRDRDLLFPRLKLKADLLRMKGAHYPLAFCVPPPVSGKLARLTLCGICDRRTSLIQIGGYPC
jgi:hypothetical protein